MTSPVEAPVSHSGGGRGRGRLPRRDGTGHAAEERSFPPRRRGGEGGSPAAQQEAAPPGPGVRCARGGGAAAGSLCPRLAHGEAAEPRRELPLPQHRLRGAAAEAALRRAGERRGRLPLALRAGAAAAVGRAGRWLPIPAAAAGERHRGTVHADVGARQGRARLRAAALPHQRLAALLRPAAAHRGRLRRPHRRGGRGVLGPGPGGAARRAAAGQGGARPRLPLALRPQRQRLRQPKPAAAAAERCGGRPGEAHFPRQRRHLPGGRAGRRADGRRRAGAVGTGPEAGVLPQGGRPHGGGEPAVAGKLPAGHPGGAGGIELHLH